MRNRSRSRTAKILSIAAILAFAVSMIMVIAPVEAIAPPVNCGSATSTGLALATWTFHLSDISLNNCIGVGFLLHFTFFLQTGATMTITATDGTTFVAFPAVCTTEGGICAYSFYDYEVAGTSSSTTYTITLTSGNGIYTTGKFDFVFWRAYKGIQFAGVATSCSASATNRTYASCNIGVQNNALVVMNAMESLLKCTGNTCSGAYLGITAFSSWTCTAACNAAPATCEGASGDTCVSVDAYIAEASAGTVPIGFVCQGNGCAKIPMNLLVQVYSFSTTGGGAPSSTTNNYQGGCPSKSSPAADTALNAGTTYWYYFQNVQTGAQITNMTAYLSDASAQVVNFGIYLIGSLAAQSASNPAFLNYHLNYTIPAGSTDRKVTMVPNVAISANQGILITIGVPTASTTVKILNGNPCASFTHLASSDNPSTITSAGAADTFGGVYYAVVSYLQTQVTTTTATTGGSTTTTFTTTATQLNANYLLSNPGNWIVMFLLLLLPVAILGGVARLGFGGAVAGLAIGTLMNFIAGIFQIWEVFFMVIVLLALVFGKRELDR